MELTDEERDVLIESCISGLYVPESETTLEDYHKEVEMCADMLSIAYSRRNHIGYECLCCIKRFIEKMKDTAQLWTTDVVEEIEAPIDSLEHDWALRDAKGLVICLSIREKLEQEKKRLDEWMREQMSGREGL